MQLSIRNKWISFKGSSVVQDLEGKDVLKIVGKFWTFTRKKSVCELDGTVKYVIKNKIISLFGRTAYVFDDKGEKVCTLKRKIFSLRDRYFVESPLGKIEINGNIFQFNYKITLDGKEIGHISRKVSLRDSFVLDINDEFDYRLFVALVIAIDNITDRRDQTGTGFNIGGNIGN